MHLTQAVAVLVTLCITFILFARLFPWDKALERRSGPPPAPSPAPSTVVHPARPAVEGLDQMEDTINEIESVLAKIDDVYIDSHTRKWSRIPPSHIELFDEVYENREKPPL